MFGKGFETTFYVDGMHCEGCKRKVTQALGEIEGVKKVKVNLADGQVKIKSAQKVEFENIKSAVANLGYSVREN